MRIGILFFGLTLLLSCTAKKKAKIDLKQVYSKEFIAHTQHTVDTLEAPYSKNYARYQQLEKKLLDLLEYPESQREIIDEIKIVIQRLENLNVTRFNQKAIQARLQVFKSMLFKLELQVFGEKNAEHPQAKNHRSVYLSESELSGLIQFFTPIKQAISRFNK